jgi:hypothetical protein
MSDCKGKVFAHCGFVDINVFVKLVRAFAVKRFQYSSIRDLAMTRSGNDARVVSCRCGQVALETEGKPIAATICHCSSCRDAGRQLEALSGAGTILNKDGGTPFILFRKDRVHCLRGGDHLREHRLNPKSPTRRVVATCCNTAMFLDFTKGHWVSLYKSRMPHGDQTRTHNRNSGVFVSRLVMSWAAMGFKIPKIDYAKGRIGE